MTSKSSLKSIIRCQPLEESLQEITFLIHSINDPNDQKRRQEMISEFYQEEYQDPDDPMSFISRSRVPRQKVRARLSKIPVSVFDLSTVNRMIEMISNLLSGYVHGGYVFIMELYEGHPAQYHIQGMLNTPRMADCAENFTNIIYRSILATKGVAFWVGETDIQKRAGALAEHFATKTGCVMEAPAA